ncbi:MAG TPA: hypothetical protein VFD58_06380 [Blastocatellia bacterium]|nr:hypothetical protein [Blastocatellia bacterium]
MALTLLFTPASMNAAQYDECISRLAAAGAGAPAGRLYHVCFGSGNQLSVFDVWDSMASFEQFGQTLMPILHDLGINPGTPTISEVHSIIGG